ncbi:MAG: general secretion pathway protein GspB [Gammaproteobacteria bacterium]
MSFILDALRKSEHERQRSAVPGLSHVPLATARSELPVWTLLVIGVLAAAVLVLGGAWWQSQRSLNASTASSTAAIAAPIASSPPTVAVPTPAAPPTVATPPPAAAPTSVAIAQPVQPSAVASASLLQDKESAAALDERTQSLADAAIVPKQPAATGPTLPSVTALLAQGIDVPPLKLELHAYSDKPAERFVFINGHKYREGERLTEGPEVVKIEPNGVVLSQRGQRFQLAPE